ncbi:hypothetical protein [Natranaeroarchaeum aerophilus]|uniref:Archaeal histidine kinase 4TM domain-containing protein n=1 Tax=Natranaeroarchaeum aerophilus TaxID=2917711 RepID=A0AAE3FPY9_9EURY|nr:hypothetical protein [Natranaeroarchaeum aerophilus]MCL9813502.1 hypothetical protein [Natranaeroarchaeum aerophilus]
MFSKPQHGSPLYDRRLPASILVVIGVLLGGLTLEHVVTHPEPPAWWAAEFLVVVGLTATILYSAYWLAASEFEPAALWDTITWMLVGVIGFTGLAGGLIVHQAGEGGSVAEPTFVLLVLSMIGALLGLALGVALHSRTALISVASDEHEPSSDHSTGAVVSVTDDGEQLRHRQQRIVLEILVDAAPEPVTLGAVLEELEARDQSDVTPEQLRTELRQDVLPNLLSTELIEFDRTRRTLSFAGPDCVADAFRSE